MATLVKQDSRYYLQFYDAHRTPSRKKVPLKTTRKGPALAKQRELEDAQTERRYDPWTDDAFGYDRPDDSSLTLREACERFVAEKAANGKKENTVRTYSAILRQFAEVFPSDCRLDAVDALTLHLFVYDPRVAAATRYKRFGHVRTFLRWASKNGLTRMNHVGGLTPPPKPAKLPKAITEAEVSTLCDRLQEEHDEKRRRETVREGESVWRIPLFWFAYYTGMRVSELARLRWGHVDFEKGLVYIYEQKNGKEQTVPLNKRARGVLAPLLPGGKDDYVFRPPTSKSGQRSPRCFAERASRAFREARNEAGLDRKLSFHSLRHGFCTRLAEAGKPLYVIKEAARHADVSTSMIYVHMTNVHLKAELDDVFD